MDIMATGLLGFSILGDEFLCGGMGKQILFSQTVPGAVAKVQKDSVRAPLDWLKPGPL